MAILSTLIADALKTVIKFTGMPVQPISGSSGWFVANTSTKTAESDPDDPVEYALGAQSKVKIIETVGKSYLDLAHLYVGTDPADVVSVRAFGYWSYSDDVTVSTLNSILPSGVSASYPTLDAANVGGGFWAPLYAPIPSGEHEQDFAATPDVTSDGASPNYKLAGGVSYALQGAERAVVLVSVARTDMTVGMVIGRVGV